RHHSHERPRCVRCGNESGPWVPTGEHCEHGVQTFECPPGEGCNTPAEIVEQNAIADPLAWGRPGALPDRDIAADEYWQRQAQAEIADARAEEVAAGIDLIRENILDSIEKSGMDVPQVAHHAGLGIHHLTDVLGGREVPTVRDLLLLANALNVLAGDRRPALEFDISPADTAAATADARASYCPTRDGHPDEPLAEDKVCWSPDPLVAPLSLHPSPLVPNPAYAETMARRKQGQDLAHLHIETRHHDVSFDLTPEEARRLARCLVAVAEQVEQEVTR